MEKKLVYEYVNGLMSHPIPPEDRMEAANVLYQRYLTYMQNRHRADAKPLSFAQFLLSDAKATGFDSFLWDVGMLVKVKAGKQAGSIGLTVGYTLVGCNTSYIKVCVRTSAGEMTFSMDEIEKADIPPEVLEYVKSTLRDQVHTKVDEAFDGGQ
jgi:hypothetical protein